MSVKKSWVWEAYLLVYTIIVFRKTYYFFSPSSDVHLYFSVLNAFTPIFPLKYILSCLQITINVFHLIPLALYIYHKRVFNQFFWTSLFILRIILDCCGHSYEWNQFIAALHANPTMAIGISSLFASFHIPSYIACYHYALRHNNIFKKPT